MTFTVLFVLFPTRVYAPPVTQWQSPLYTIGTVGVLVRCLLITLVLMYIPLMLRHRLSMVLTLHGSQPVHQNGGLRFFVFLLNTFIFLFFVCFDSNVYRVSGDDRMLHDDGSVILSMLAAMVVAAAIVGLEWLVREVWPVSWCRARARH